MDPDVLKSEFNLTMKDLWSVQCKFYDLGESFQSQCFPCLMFTPPDYWNLTTETVSYQDIGNTGCGFLKGGGEIRKIFA